MSEEDSCIRLLIIFAGLAIAGFTLYWFGSFLENVEAHLLLPTFKFLAHFFANYGRATAFLIYSVALAWSEIFFHSKEVDRLSTEFHIAIKRQEKPVLGLRG